MLRRGANRTPVSDLQFPQPFAKVSTKTDRREWAYALYSRPRHPLTAASFVLQGTVGSTRWVRLSCRTWQMMIGNDAGSGTTAALGLLLSMVSIHPSYLNITAGKRTVRTGTGWYGRGTGMVRAAPARNERMMPFLPYVVLRTTRTMDCHPTPS